MSPEPSQGTTGAAPGSPEALARLFHETYERLAPEHGFQGGEEEAISWEELPDDEKTLMIAVAAEVGAALEAMVRQRVAEELYEQAAGYTRTAQRGGALKFELTRRAQAVAAAADRIARGDQVTSGTGPITLHLGPTPPKQEPRRRRGGQA